MIDAEFDLLLLDRFYYFFFSYEMEGFLNSLVSGDLGTLGYC